MWKYHRDGRSGSRKLVINPSRPDCRRPHLWRPQNDPSPRQHGRGMSYGFRPVEPLHNYPPVDKGAVCLRFTAAILSCEDLWVRQSRGSDHRSSSDGGSSEEKSAVSLGVRAPLSPWCLAGAGEQGEITPTGQVIFLHKRSRKWVS